VQKYSDLSNFDVKKKIYAGYIFLGTFFGNICMFLKSVRPIDIWKYISFRWNQHWNISMMGRQCMLIAWLASIWLDGMNRTNIFRWHCFFDACWCIIRKSLGFCLWRCGNPVEISCQCAWMVYSRNSISSKRMITFRVITGQIDCWVTKETNTHEYLSAIAKRRV
jgi:hypothetical protein